MFHALKPIERLREQRDYTGLEGDYTALEGGGVERGWWMLRRVWWDSGGFSDTDGKF